MSGFHDLTERHRSTTARWEGMGFRYELEAWLMSEVGPLVQLEPFKMRPWATVWRAETMDSVWFAKQNCPGQNHEAALLTVLNEVAPEHVVPLTAADLTTGLLLTADQGPVLGEAGDLETWCRIAASAAALQREVVPHADRLPLVTMRPEEAPAYVEQRVDELGALPAKDPRAMAAEDVARIHAMLPTIQGWADQVAALGLPMTLNHNDLHSYNVFDLDGGLRFFDFGDSMLTEPLGVLRIPANVLASQLACEMEDPRVARMTDAVLEVWSDLAPAAELRAALPAALDLARLARVESWVRCLGTMTAAELREYGGAPRDWLLTLVRDGFPAGG